MFNNYILMMHGASMPLFEIIKSNMATKMKTKSYHIIKVLIQPKQMSNDQEPIQSYPTAFSRHHTGKEHKHLRQHIAIQYKWKAKRSLAKLLFDTLVRISNIDDKQLITGLFGDWYVLTYKPHKKQLWQIGHCLLQFCFKMAFVIQRPQNLIK